MGGEETLSWIWLNRTLLLTTFNHFLHLHQLPLSFIYYAHSEEKVIHSEHNTKKQMKS